MIYNSEVIGEFEENKEPEGGYTDRLCELYLVKGRIPADGDWQAVCISHFGFEKRIPETEIESTTGKYVLGAYEIIMRTAGLRRPELDLEKVKKAGRLSDEDIRKVFGTEEGGEDRGEE